MNQPSGNEAQYPPIGLQASPLAPAHIPPVPSAPGSYPATGVPAHAAQHWIAANPAQPPAPATHFNQASTVQQQPSSRCITTASATEASDVIGYIGDTVIVVDPRFCAPQQSTLVLQEKRGWKTDNFCVTDVNGKTCFKADASLLSLHGTRRLLDGSGTPVLDLKQKLVTLHGTWVMLDNKGKKLAEIKPSLTRHVHNMVIKPSVKVYLNDGDKEADFIVKGNFLAKKFEIRQVMKEGESIIATVHKESRFASTKAFMQSLISDANRYFLTIEPGVDAAFVTALALLCDEIYHDA